MYKRQAVTDAIEKGTPISREIADLIANGMKSWAKSLNVTHYTVSYTHLFGPHPLLYTDKYNLSIKQPERGNTIG